MKLLFDLEEESFFAFSLLFVVVLQLFLNFLVVSSGLLKSCLLELRLPCHLVFNLVDQVISVFPLFLFLCQDLERCLVIVTSGLLLNPEQVKGLSCLSILMLLTDFLLGPLLLSFLLGASTLTSDKNSVVVPASSVLDPLKSHGPVGLSSQLSLADLLDDSLALSALHRRLPLLAH